MANGYFVLQPNRVGREDNEYGADAVTFYGTSQVIDPRGNHVGAPARVSTRRSSCATSTWTSCSRCATTGSSTANRPARHLREIVEA